MNNLKKHIRYLLMLAMVLPMVSCMKGALDHNDDECDYSVQLIYHYNEENTSETNRLAQVVYTLDEYIFDEEGILYAINPLTIDECTGQYVSELDLPPGRYSVIGMGNVGEMSRATDNYGNIQVGVTHRDDMLLTHINRSPSNTTDRLYHGYRTFTVPEIGTSFIRVDMVHSHHILRFRIRWKRNPPALGDYYATMQYVPSEYNLMPEYVYPQQYKCEAHDTDLHDEYNSVCQAVRHHITTVKQDRNILTHTIDLRRNVDAEVKGMFVMYRIKNETTPTMSLYTGTTGTGLQIMKSIDLQRYFAAQKIDLDRTLRQEYNIEILIDGNSVLVYPVTLADWEEGGSL